MSWWSDSQLVELFTRGAPLIDVRAPIEYAAGAIPGSVNLPLMNDEERHLVGLCYKKNGQAAAIALGHQLVSGEVKARRVRAWVDHIERHPRAEVFCLRGGLRSQISCQWLAEVGIKRTALPGGYKRLRQFLLAWLEEAPLPRLVRLAGMTGVGKSQLLASLPHALDLEKLANHRGSAFGDLGGQPSQASFESALAAQLINRPCAVVEDESNMIGCLRIPRRFFRRMQESPLVVLEASLQERVMNIHREYVLAHDAEFFLHRVSKIERKLGGLMAREIKEAIQTAFLRGMELGHHEEWITRLLTRYYDPAYQHGLDGQAGLIRLRGGENEVRAFLQSAFV